MHDTHPLPLRLTPVRLAEFCRQLRQRNADPAQALQQLTTVQALLGLCVEDRTHPAYVQASEYLNAQLDELRTTLLTRHAVQLGDALRRRDQDSIANSFRSLSRSGFALAAAHAWEQLDIETRTACAHWLTEWHRDAHRRASAASPYPDAPDFRAAGIALETYLAMQELLTTVAADGCAAGSR